MGDGEADSGCAARRARGGARRHRVRSGIDGVGVGHRPGGRIAPTDPAARDHDPGHGVGPGRPGLRMAAGDDGATRNRVLFSDAAFRYVDVVIGAIVAAALVWFAVTVLNAPGQRADPGVTVIMGGIGVAILGVALLVLVLRMLLAQAVARDVEAAQMQAELDEVI